MGTDIAGSSAWRAVEEYFGRLYGPVLGGVGAPLEVRAAPGGRRAAVVAEVRSAWRDRPVGRIHLVDLDTGRVGAAVDGSGTESAPCWSPDGDRLAYLSAREPGAPTRARLFDVATGGVSEQPETPGPVEFLAFSPGSDRLLLGVTRPPRTVPGQLPELRATGDDPGERALWLWTPDAGTVAPLTSGIAVWEADWCGADRVAAVASRHPTENSWYTAELVLVDARTGAHATAYRSDRQLALPTGAPDGGAVAFVESWCSDRGVAAGAVLLLDTAADTVSTVDTHGADVTDLDWRDALWYAGIREPRTVAGRIDPVTGTATEEWSGTDTLGQFYPALSGLGDAGFAAVRQGWRRPPELAVVRDGTARTVRGGEHDGTRWLSGSAGTAEHVTWTAPDGLTIGGFLCRPAGPGPYPLVLHVHGGPVLCFRNRWQLGYPVVPLLVRHGYAVLSANPRGSTGRGRAFADAVAGDMGGADVDDVLAGVDAMVARGIAEPGRVGVTGHSYGGYLTCLLVGRTDRFAAAVALSAVTDWYVQHHASPIGWFDTAFLADTPDTPGGRHFTRGPIAYAHRVTTPTLLVAGAADPVVPPVQSVEFHTALAERGVPSELAVYPGEGHVIRGQRAVVDHHARLLDWFTRHLPSSVP